MIMTPTPKPRKLRLNHYQTTRIHADYYHVDSKLLADELNMPLSSLHHYAKQLKVQDHRELPERYYPDSGKMFNVNQFKCWITGI
jgi:hypothetical protein